MRVSVDPALVRAAFAPLASSPAFAESAAVVAAGGAPVEMLQAMSLRPELLRAFAALSEAIYCTPGPGGVGGILERPLKELVILDVSMRNRCQFCTSSHEAICRSIGMGDGVASRLRRFDEDRSGFGRREALAVRYARHAVADATAVPEELFVELREAFSDPEIVELTALIGLISMLNLFNDCLGVRYRDDYGASGAAAR